MEFIIGKNGTKMKASKDEKEFLREITREVKETMAKKVVKDNLSGVKLKKTMTKEEVEKIIQIIGENYSAVCLSMAECILEATDKIHNAVKTSTNFITLINDELGIELSEDDEDEDTDDDDEEDEDENERSED